MQRTRPGREKYNRNATESHGEMGVKDKVEACGRCSMSTVVGLTDGDGKDRNPFSGERIELSEDELRSVSKHVVVLGNLKDRLDRWATKVTYGR